MTWQERTDDAETEASDINNKLRQIEESLDKTDRENRIDDGRSSVRIPPTPAPVSPPPPIPPLQPPISRMPHPTPQPKKSPLKGFLIYTTIVLLLLMIIGISLALIFGGYDMHGIYPAKE
ncbi:hypothetical protein DRN77_03945, partial [Methanosarcinales archaeon]